MSPDIIRRCWRLRLELDELRTKFRVQIEESWRGVASQKSQALLQWGHEQREGAFNNPKRETPLMNWEHSGHRADGQLECLG